jgi:hypothetical protein
MLLKASTGCLYKKLSDIDPTMKPFDAFQICNAPAYVVLAFIGKERKSKTNRRTIYFIPAREIDEKIKRGELLLTESGAKELAEREADWT